MAPQATPDQRPSRVGRAAHCAARSARPARAVRTPAATPRGTPVGCARATARLRPRHRRPLAEPPRQGDTAPPRVRARDGRRPHAAAAAPGGDLHRAVDHAHGARSVGSRRRRQRLARPRARRGPLLEAVEPPRGGREGLGDGAAPRAVVHLRERVLVVRDARVDRRDGDPAPRLQGRRPQAARLPDAAAGAARRTAGAPRRVPALQVLGARGRHRVDRLDRRRDGRASRAPPRHAHPLLPAAPRLCAPEVRARVALHRARAPRDRPRRGWADRPMPRARREAARRQRVRHRPRARRGVAEPRPPRRGLSRRPPRGRPRGPRPRGEPRLRRLRPPGRACLGARSARSRRRRGDPREGGRRRAHAVGRRATRRGPRPRARGRHRLHERVRPLVRLRLVVRRRARTRLRAHRRHPPEAGLRPVRALPRSASPLAEGPRAAETPPPEARFPRAPRRDPARRLARARLARTRRGREGVRPGPPRRPPRSLPRARAPHGQRPRRDPRRDARRPPRRRAPRRTHPGDARARLGGVGRR